MPVQWIMSREFRERAPLALNVILAVMAVALILHRPAPMPASAIKTTNEAPVAPPVIVTSQPESPSRQDAASAADRRRWLIDQLRAMGVPDKILARIVLANLDKQWNRHAAI